MMSGEVFNNNQLRYQYFMSSTMTTWNNAGVSTGEDLGSRRVCSITRSDLGNGLGNNEVTAQVYSQIKSVRCVRDLTPDEAGKTYEQN